MFPLYWYNRPHTLHIIHFKFTSTSTSLANQAYPLMFSAGVSIAHKISMNLPL